jgi:ABC-type multidrug transport system fused ATPase/permease subunit
VLIVALVFNMLRTLADLSNSMPETFDLIGSIRDCINTLVVDRHLTDKSDAKALQVSRGQVDFNDVTFSYENGQKVFDGLELHIPAGQRVGLVGASGAGKSTLISLLMRMNDVQSGGVCIDGQAVNMVTQISLRRQIGIIPQDSILFHRSIFENIRYGRMDATREDVEQAARKAHAHDFIMALPKGYDTMVGERGVKLSGGQRQRIAVARAILKNAPILLLDEATSALDSESEAAIQSSMADLMVGKTVIAIAHRLSTIASLNRLIVMDQGRIVEDGSHDELLRKGGYYAKLWAHQSGGFLKEEAVSEG